MASPSLSVRTLSKAGPTENERKLANVRPVAGRVDVSGWNIPALQGLLPSSKVEALYARSNNLVSLEGIPVLPNLRVLDVSSNSLTTVAGFVQPPLRMLFLSANNIFDVSVVPSISTLEVLSLSNNRLASLDGMQIQPELRV